MGRRTATLALLLGLMIALLASVPGLRGVLRTAGRIGPGWLVAAVGLEILSCASFVVVFRLFFDRLESRDARLLAWTEQASGALLPGGGAGGLAVGAGLMRLTGAPLRWIVRRSAGLFFLSGGVSGAALVGAGLALLAGARGPDDFARVVLPTALAAVGIAVLAALPAVVGRRSASPRWLSALAAGVREAEELIFTKPPSWRLLGGLGYLVFDVAVLWIILRSFGHAPSVAVVLLAYSIGYAASALPIPGGIGVLDAGLAGALVLYGVSPVHAAAAVIVYHAIAFWVPGLGGLLAYLRLRPGLLKTEPTDSPPEQASQQLLASRETSHESAGTTPETDYPRLGRDPDRRPRARPLHGAGV